MKISQTLAQNTYLTKASCVEKYKEHLKFSNKAPNLKIGPSKLEFHKSRYPLKILSVTIYQENANIVTTRYHSILTRMAKVRKVDNTRFW